MTERTPAQIIGNDRLLQLIFEGYAVVPAKLGTSLHGVVCAPCEAAAIDRQG